MGQYDLAPHASTPAPERVKSPTRPDEGVGNHTTGFSFAPIVCFAGPPTAAPGGEETQYMKIAFVHNVKRSDDEAEAEFDTEETIAALTGWLESLGHHVVGIDAGGPASSLIARLEGCQPDLVFNTAEGTQGRAREAFYPALFEQLGFPFTGSDAYVCTVTLDKALTKSVVATAGVPVPRGWLVRDVGAFTLPDELRFPVFVKPNFEGSSKGIDEKSKVQDAGTLIRRLAELLERYPEGILVEEYIPGRDVAVSFLEGAAPESGGILPPVVYEYGDNDIYDYRLKNHDSDDVSVAVGKGIDEGLSQRLTDLARASFAALSVRDLGRIDFRVTEDGRVYFLEVNALPSLEPGAGLYAAAAAQGMAKPERVIEAVLQSAIRRHNLSPTKLAKRGRTKVRVGLTYNLKRTADESDAEFDSQDTIDAICRAVSSLGHEAIPLEATPELPSVLRASNVDVVFNIAEGIGGRTRESQVPALLDLCEVPFTGSDAATLAVTLDKGMAKRMVKDAGVHIAPFQVISQKRTKLDPTLRFPLLAKPVYEGSSKGIKGSPVVDNKDALKDRVHELLDTFQQPVLLEEFLPGREFTVGLLGERRPRALSVMEVVFQDAAGDFPTYSYEAKQAEQNMAKFECPADIDAELEERLVKLAKKAFVALGCRDVARVDIRLDGDGNPAFIECNPLPGLSPGFSDLCVIAERSGLDYTALIGEILAPALKRWRRSRGDKSPS